MKKIVKTKARGTSVPATVQQIRNATVKISVAGTTLLFDPMLMEKDGYPPIPGCRTPDLRWPTCSLPFPVADILDGVDAVVVTHCHVDHFDRCAADVIPKNLPMLVQDGIDAAEVGKMGFTDVRTIPDGGMEFKNLTLFKTPGNHGNKATAMPVFEKIGIRYETMGVVVKAEGAPVTYVAGDTIWYGGVAETLAKYDPDVAILNAARAETMGSGPIIMGLEDIAAVHEAAPDAILVASHLDCVGHATLDRKGIREYAARDGLQDKLLVPEDGESIDFV